MQSFSHVQLKKYFSFETWRHPKIGCWSYAVSFQKPRGKHIKKNIKIVNDFDDTIYNNGRVKMEPRQNGLLWFLLSCYLFQKQFLLERLTSATLIFVNFCW